MGLHLAQVQQICTSAEASLRAGPSRFFEGEIATPAQITGMWLFSAPEDPGMSPDMTNRGLAQS
jgi:hypothetical protein